MQSEVEKAAQRLRRAIARAEDGAGTPPAKIAVKLIPSDWHNVVAAAKESASLIETLYRREEELREALARITEHSLVRLFDSNSQEPAEEAARALYGEWKAILEIAHSALAGDHGQAGGAQG